MPRITNWSRESRTPTLAYRNTKTGARTVLHRAPDSYRYRWRGAILVDGYPVWSQGFETKDATAFCDEFREHPAPGLSCPECPNDDVLESADQGYRRLDYRWATLVLVQTLLSSFHGIRH